MTLDEKIKRLGIINTGIGMKIVMKSDATERQMKLAKEFYPKAVVIKDIKEEKLDYSKYYNFCFSLTEMPIFDQFDRFDETIDTFEDIYPETDKDTPLYYEIAA